MIHFLSKVLVLITLIQFGQCDWEEASNQSIFSDANGWDDPEYYSTMQVITLYDSVWLFIRGPSGLEVHQYNYTDRSWSQLPTLTNLSDSNDWNSDPKYYSTIQVIAMYSQFWVIARSANGLEIYQYDPLANLWNSKQILPGFSYTIDWDQKEYYSTIKALAHSGKIWVFARGPEGEEIHQYDPDTDTWNVLSTLSALSNDEQWNEDPKYYSTIRIVIYESNFWLFARGFDGMRLYQYDPVPNNWTTKRTLPNLSDENGWGDEEYYSTIQALVVQSRLWLLVRGQFGVETYEYDLETDTWAGKQRLSNLSNAQNWNIEQYYSTIRTVALENKIAVLARATDGMEYYEYSLITEEWASLPVLTALSDENGWNKIQYYSTIRIINYNDRVSLFARGPDGVEVYEYIS